MRPFYRRAFSVLFLACGLVLSGYEGNTEDPAHAASAASSPGRQATELPHGGKTISSANKPNKPAVAKSKNKKPEGHRVRQVPRHQKQAIKKQMPEVMAEPRPDVFSYGLLKHSRRYHMDQAISKDGLRNPHTDDLLHDHFQELDRNHDGVIDPVEQVTGRLDIEKDMGHR
jgi:hypothetical protein